MAIDLANPWALLLGPVLLYLTWRWFRQDRRARLWAPRRRRLSLGLRLAIVALLVLALAGLRWQWSVRGQAVVFAVDASASARAARGAAEDWLTRALSSLRRGDAAGVVMFGREALVERPLTTGQEGAFKQGVTLDSRPDAQATDVESALRLAAGMAGSDRQRRVVVLTDGRENLGDAIREAQWLRSQGVRVDVAPLTVSRGPEVLVDSLRVPGTLFLGERFDLTATVQSSVRTAATLRFYADRTLLSEQRVNLEAGANRFARSLLADRTGYHAFRAEVEPDQDSLVENNQASALALVRGQPRVLVVAPTPDRSPSGREDGQAVAAVLKATGVDAELSTPYAMPSTLEGLAGYSAVFMVDVPATDLGDDVMTSLQAYVRDVGGGLAMVGGPDSYGLGGYFQTPVEEALPVYMDLRGKARLPSVGLVLVIDKSGSMSEGAGTTNKMELAKEAAARSVDLMAAKDQLGVVAFDGAAKWVVDLSPASDPKAMKDAIGTLRPDGGTYIYPGLRLAYEALKNANTQVKHIILLTDGISQGGDYEGLLAQMKQADITLSTVAVGSDADRSLLTWLAQMGKGRYYFTSDPTSVPKIFTKETLLASRAYMVNETFMPAIASPSPLLKGLGDGVPALDGYVATSPKETAEMVLVSHQGDPVLAAWQYGLGRSVAWTPDAGSRWMGRWAGTPPYSTLFGNMLSWLLPTSQAGGLTLESSASGGQALVTVRVPPGATGVVSGSDTGSPGAATGSGAPVSSGPSGAQGTQPAGLAVIDPDQRTLQVPLELTAPGVYQARFAASKPGVYFYQVQGQDGQTVMGLGGVAVPYSQEYRDAGVDESFLTRLAAAGGGEVLTDPSQAFLPNLPRTWAGRDLWPWLLLLAALLLPLDVASRRLTVIPHEWVAWWSGLTRRLPLRHPAAAGPAPAPELGRLRQRKAAAAEAFAVRAEAARPGAAVLTDDRAAPVRTPRPQTSPAAAPPAAGAGEPSPGRSAAEKADQNDGDSYTSRLLQAKRRADRK
ncbi:MAG: VWA domain-containing protein [Bacillota bacterium]